MSSDTRPIHRELFQDLTPPGCSYFAGQYRGDQFRCLRYYRVQVPADPRVGWAPEAVVRGMRELEVALIDAIVALDEMHGASETSPADRLLRAAQVACEAMVQLFTIHPYANGNGHAGRFALWAILIRYGYVPKSGVWPVDPSPGDLERPRYSGLIARYRDGHPEELIGVVLSGILG